MASIFSKIISGEIASYKIAENDLFYAFLDVFPIVPGHTLVVPKQQVDNFFDMEDKELSSILIFTQPIAKAIKSALPCLRCGISVIGLEVAHAHLHIVPIQSADDLNFTRVKLQMSHEELMDVQLKILAQLKKDG